MNVYLVISIYFDGCDYWHNNEAIYSDKTEAELNALERREKEVSDDTDYYVEEWNVL